jgi:ribA/ribD-fused uncharacterized protein
MMQVRVLLGVLDLLSAISSSVNSYREFIMNRNEKNLQKRFAPENALISEVKGSPLSNMALYPFFDNNGIRWETSEHYYQAAKFVEGSEPWKMIRSNSSPYHAKSVSRKFPAIGNFDEIKIQAMKWAIWYKFTQNQEALDYLRKTNPTIVEFNNWHDNFWGHCVCPRCASVQKKNNLGVLLMMLRDKLAQDIITDA